MGLLKTLAFLNVLRTLAIIIIVYYVLRWLARIFAPVLMRRMVSKMQEKAQQQYNHQRQNTTQAKERETLTHARSRSANRAGRYFRGTTQ